MKRRAVPMPTSQDREGEGGLERGKGNQGRRMAASELSRDEGGRFEGARGSAEANKDTHTHTREREREG